MEAFEALAEQRDICLATTQRILNNAPDAAFDKIVHKLLSEPKVSLNGVLLGTYLNFK